MDLVRRLSVLRCASQAWDKGRVSTRGVDVGVLVEEPILVWVLDTDAGLVLVDTGLDPDALTDPARRSMLGDGPPPVVRPGDGLAAGLACLGCEPADVAAIVLTHTHWDHVGGVRHLPRVPVYLQRAELAALEAGEGDPGFVAAVRAGADLRAVDGDAEPIPGVRLLATHGHTPGHQSVAFELARAGPVVLAGDAADLEENLARAIPPGGTSDLAGAVASLERLRALRSGGARVVPGHDPASLAFLPLAPAWWD